MTIQKSKFAYVAAAFAAFQCSTAIAQSAPQSANSDEAYNDGDIIVTAQRRSESLERTPVAISVVSGEELANQAIVSEADLQIATPGLTVKAGQGSNQLNYSIRGQTVDAFTSSRPSVLPYWQCWRIVLLRPGFNSGLEGSSRDIVWPQLDWWCRSLLVGETDE
jgi:iron complex outermembrane recepter protein